MLSKTIRCRLLRLHEGGDVTWFRVDDGFYDHPKVKSLPRGATRKDADALVAADLWHTAGHDCADCPDIPRGHYLFHQWSQYQPTRDQVEAERDAARKRMQER